MTIITNEALSDVYSKRGGQETAKVIHLRKVDSSQAVGERKETGESRVPVLRHRHVA